MKETQRVPLYTQIREYIYDQISRGNWQASDRLPSEKELSEQFNVSRITVKNALAELTKQGLIYRIQGKGSFVADGSKGEPSLYKSQVSLQSNNCIAFLIPRLENTFTAKLVRNVEQECAAAGMKMILALTHDSQETEKKLIREMIQLGVSGIIIFPVDGEGYNEEIVKLSMNNYPLVLIDRYFRGIETNSVCSDNSAGAYNAVNHLLSLGHRKIGVVSTFSSWTTSIEDRIEGYEKALAEAKIPINRLYRCDHFNPEQMNLVLRTGEANLDAKRDIQQFLKSNQEMTAIFATNIAVGLTVIAAAREIGRNVPDDLSVVYYDFEPLPLLFMRPTCVIQDEESLVKQAVELLFAVVREPQRKRERILIPSSLTIGDSTAPLSNAEKRKTYTETH
ncbi:GntR family transcriptional regulator [Paenibacillus sp. GCM10027626]|uniref:GntR family transcriptional regulator n=1 Tax=Paenibacillus sp. GCM10027626 TaxID=3273411 RepID=UPI00363E7608